MISAVTVGANTMPLSRYSGIMAGNDLTRRVGCAHRRLSR
jgi:hypothetical protein